MSEDRRTILRVGVTWGVALGAAVCVWTMAVHLLGWYTTNLGAGKQADVAALVLPVVILFLAIRDARRRLGGNLSVLQGVATGVVAGLASTPIATGFLWYYHHGINPRWTEYLVAYERARLVAAGASPSDVAKQLDALRRLSEDGAQLRGALTGTFVLSLLLSTIFAVVLRRRRP
ncbi:MAG: DUF4199 domain-containing protein [Gemmatimonadetes bacterium]|nr:DUF4199 domain-containing protein [Gemmatimonadota bacterium]